MTNKNQKWNDLIWPLIKLYSRARRKGFWLETIDLLYYILIFELRSLMTLSIVGKDGKALLPKMVEQQQYLSGLLKLAHDKGFIKDTQLIKQIEDFNSKRGKAIHKMLDGKINYEELKIICEMYGADLPKKIQDLWLTYTIGPEIKNK